MTFDQVSAWIVAANMPRAEGWEHIELKDFSAADLILTVERWLTDTHSLPSVYMMVVDWPKRVPKRMLMLVNRSSSCPKESVSSYIEWGSRKVDDELKDLVESYGGPMGLEFTTVPDPSNKNEE